MTFKPSLPLAAALELLAAGRKPACVYLTALADPSTSSSTSPMPGEIWGLRPKAQTGICGFLRTFAQRLQLLRRPGKAVACRVRSGVLNTSRIRAANSVLSKPCSPALLPKRTTTARSDGAIVMRWPPKPCA